MTDHIKDFITAFTSWAFTQPDILAVALVGSYAREAAKEDSDIDLVVLANGPTRYVEDTENFESMEDFLNRGIGYCVVHEDRIVSAATSMAMCRGAIDIEIETVPEFRRRNWARS